MNTNGRTMNPNGRVHPGKDPEVFQPVEPDPLQYCWEATDLHEDEAACIHLEGMEPGRCTGHLTVYDSKGEDEVAEVPQLCMVEAKCKANWPV
jgi:hypothetical protein